MGNYFSKPYTFDRVARLVICVLVVAGIFFMVRSLKSVLAPFFIAWLFAYLFQPLVDFFQRFFKSKSFSILLVMFSILAAIVGFLFFMVPTFISEFVKLKSLLAAKGNMDASILPQDWMDYIRRITTDSQLVDNLTPKAIVDMLSNIMPHFLSLMTSSMNGLLWVFGFIFVLIYLFFILRDQDALATDFVKLIPQHYKKVFLSLMYDLKLGMSAYFRKQALVAMIDAVMFAVGFYIIGMPMGIVMGVTLGALNMVPYLQYLGLPPAALLMLIKAAETDSSIGVSLLLLAVVFLVVQIVQDLYLIPKFMGKSMGLHPAVILLSLSIWGYLLGVIGMIIALPATTILFSYYRRYILKENVHRPFAEEAAEHSAAGDVDQGSFNELEETGNEEN